MPATRRSIRLEEIYLRYANARKPGKAKHDVAYRMRSRL